MHAMSASSWCGDSTLRPPLVGFQGLYSTEAGLVALTAVLPALAHALGIPVQPSFHIYAFSMLAVLQLILIPIITAPIHRAPVRGSK